jgi:hypothetical protein
MRVLQAAVLAFMLVTYAHARDPDERLFRTAPKFQQSFSAGQFERNGLLVTDDIDVDCSHVKLVGRDNFVRRIERYIITFPACSCGTVSSWWTATSPPSIPRI